MNSNDNRTNDKGNEMNPEITSVGHLQRILLSFIIQEPTQWFQTSIDWQVVEIKRKKNGGIMCYLRSLYRLWML
jgi:hypothetical protein